MDELALLKPKLARLKLSGMLDTLSQALAEKWSYTQFLDTLLTDEAERRDFKQLGRRLTKSGLAPDKTLETFDFSFNPRIHAPTLRELATCRFVQRSENVFFVGPSGVGKSHAAQALGHVACRKGYAVTYERTSVLLDWIHAGRGDGTYQRRPPLKTATTAACDATTPPNESITNPSTRRHQQPPSRTSPMTTCRSDRPPRPVWPPTPGRAPAWRNPGARVLARHTPVLALLRPPARSPT